MRRVLRPLSLSLLALAVAAAGCGGGSDDKSGDAKAPAKEPPPTASATAFPSAKGKTLDTLRAGLPEGPILAPSTTASLGVGTNRVGFALFTPDRKQITDAQVALYTTDHDGGNAKGPYVARAESLKVKPQFESKTTSADPDGAKVVYVADVPISQAGRRVVTGIARVGGQLVRTTGFELRIPRNPSGGPPEVGDRPPTIHTPTLSSVAGDAQKISTRVPPAEDLLRDDYAEVAGKKPVVITFATPLLCQSRVCGPVVDVVEQVRAETKGEVSFIHQEIFQDNTVDKGYRPQVEAWRLPSEPWTFVVDRRGKIAERFEGAFSVGELERAVAKVTT